MSKPNPTEVHTDFHRVVEARWLAKTKPPGSLGRIEQIAALMARIQRTDRPRAAPVSMLLFAGDHGVYEEAVSPYPQSVTVQMVENIASGGAASSVLAALHAIDYHVFDVGLLSAPAHHGRIVERNIRRGSRNFCREDAMTHEETLRAIAVGREAVTAIAHDASVIIVGEMGIANTTSAAAIVAALLGQPAIDWVGAGTGLDAAGVARKARAVNAALSRRTFASDLDALTALGGYEIAAMTGAYLEAAAKRKVILVDGFIATAALFVAARMEPSVLESCIFSHCSNERGHRALLGELCGQPLLDLGMRLGEGSGA
ncbi:MAG: nicotinate-nucleotide--dimethylbenzimidazole phosphoribosyltransferase, partial [Burkholderiales bacterium]